MFCFMHAAIECITPLFGNLCCRSVISAPTQDDCQSSHPDQPAISEPSTSCNDHDGSSSSSTSSRGHAVASTSSSEKDQCSNTATGSTSSNSSSPINSSIVLSDLQELSVIGSGSSGVVKKVLHRPTQQVCLITRAWLCCEGMQRCTQLSAVESALT